MSKIKNLLGRVNLKSKEVIDSLHLKPADKLKLGLSSTGLGLGVYSLHKSNQLDSNKADVDHQALLALKKIHKALEERPLAIEPPSIN